MPGMTTLVTGATGNIGRMVVDHLLAAGVTDVRALTTDPVRAALPADVEVVEGNLRRPKALPPALAGVDRILHTGVAGRTLTAGIQSIIQASNRL